MIAHRKYLILLVLTVVVIALDQFTKGLIVQSFHLSGTRAVITGLFNITYVRNTGAAFGLLATSDPRFRAPFFIVVPLLALTAIGYIFRKIPNADVKLSTALSLVIGGAIGNLVDRLRYGFVVDFLDFHWNFRYHFPAFNVADSSICVGVAILMLDLILQQETIDAPTPI